MAGRVENLKPWKAGQGGNPGGRPKTKPLTGELARRLDEEAPNRKGKTWAVVITEAILVKARKGDVPAYRGPANRIEGKPVQALDVNADLSSELVDRIRKGRDRIAQMKVREPESIPE